MRLKNMRPGPPLLLSPKKLGFMLVALVWAEVPAMWEAALPSPLLWHAQQQATQ
jgi:hypothetical protein